MATSELVPFVLLALTGSVHCAGMCGGFALGVTTPTSRGRSTVRIALYVLGKSFTYVVLAVIAARAANWLSHAGAHALADEQASGDLLLTLRRGMAWVAGGCLVLFGFQALGWLSRLEVGRGRMRMPIAWFRGLLSSVKALPGPSAAFGVGVITGLLPCGLSWSALVLATQVDPATAAVGLFLFGLATGPALAVVGLGPGLLPARLRARAQYLTGPLLVLFGLFTIIRGGLPGPLAGAAPVLPSCCEQAALESQAD